MRSQNINNNFNPFLPNLPPFHPQQMNMQMFNNLANNNLGKRRNDQQSFQDDVQKKLKTTFSPKDIEGPFDMPTTLSPTSYQNPMKLTLDFNPNSFEIRNQAMMNCQNDEMERLQHIQNLRRLLKATEEHHMKQQKATMNFFANPENMARGFPDFKVKLPVYNSFQKDDITVKREENVKQEEPLLTFKPMMNLMPFNWASTHSMETYHASHDTASETSEEKLENKNAFKVPEPELLEFTRAFPDWDIATIFNFLRSGRSKDSFEKERVFRAERKKRRAQKRLKTKGVSNKSKETDKN